MRITTELEKLFDMGKSRKEKQSYLTVGEVFHIWNHLVLRYQIIETTNILANFAKDEELKVVIKMGADSLQEQVDTLEQLMNEYGIPFPPRSPKDANSTLGVEVITDRYIYNHILSGIKSMIPSHAGGFIHSNSSKIRSMFRNFLLKEMDLYDKLFEYGKLKGYPTEAPVYNPG